MDSTSANQRFFGRCLDEVCHYQRFGQAPSAIMSVGYQQLHQHLAPLGNILPLAMDLALVG